MKALFYLVGWWLLIVISSAKALADSSSLNLQLPNAGGSYQSDHFRAGDLDCSNAIGGSTNVEFGVTGIINNATSPFSSNDPLNPETKDIPVVALSVSSERERSLKAGATAHITKPIKEKKLFDTLHELTSNGK